MTVTVNDKVPAYPGNYTPGRNGVKIDRVVIHVADGTYEGTLAWFASQKCDTSAQYTVGMDGRLGQSVEESDTAYHSGLWSMNQRSIGIEHEGQPSKTPWVPSQAQLIKSAALVAEICRRHSIPIDREHIIGHFEVIPGRAARANCPGKTWPWERYLQMVREAIPSANAGHVPDKADMRAVRIFNPEGNVHLGVGTLIEGTDKCYISPAELAAIAGKLGYVKGEKK